MRMGADGRRTRGDPRRQFEDYAARVLRGGEARHGPWLACRSGDRAGAGFVLSATRARRTEGRGVGPVTPEGGGRARLCVAGRGGPAAAVRRGPVRSLRPRPRVWVAPFPVSWRRWRLALSGRLVGRRCCRRRPARGAPARVPRGRRVAPGRRPGALPALWRRVASSVRRARGWAMRRCDPVWRRSGAGCVGGRGHDRRNVAPGRAPSDAVTAVDVVDQLLRLVAR